MDQKLKRTLLHFFFPNRCPVCGDVIGAMDSFCKNCEEKLNVYTGSFSIRGASGTAAAFIYDKNISPAVILLKNGICGNAAYALGRAVAGTVQNSSFEGLPDVIVAVPMHRTDRRRRGYNQAFLIAKEASEVLGIPVAKSWIVKHKHTAQQKHLSRLMRRKNLSGAFCAAHPELIRGKKILLVDDVSTTGSTLENITALLLENGAEAVYCAVACKTLPHKLREN